MELRRRLPERNRETGSFGPILCGLLVEPAMEPRTRLTEVRKMLESLKLATMPTPARRSGLPRPKTTFANALSASPQRHCSSVFSRDFVINLRRELKKYL
jgi:hypothetical protein